jgi:hypothetical protein
VIALPDSDNRVFSLSETHGPSLVDLVGVIIVVLAWVPVATLIWSYRATLRGRVAWLAASLIIVGAITLVITIRYDLGAVWLVPAGLLVAAQILALSVIARRTKI